MSETAEHTLELRNRVKVWDLPVRLFHWALVLLMGGLFVTAEVMDDAIDIHALAGYAALTLVLFRILWGFVGNTHARFSDFVCGPTTTFRYAFSLFSRRPVFIPGHNPLGGWMVMALLLGLLAQALLGLFSNDDILFDGPLSTLVTKETSDLLTSLHHDLFPVLLVLVALHVAAVLFHKLFKGENLAPAMFTGYKDLPPGEQAAEDARGERPLLASVLLALCAGLVYLVINLA